MTDFTKPIQVTGDYHEWLTPESVIRLDSGFAIIVYRYNGRQEWSCFGPDNTRVRNLPAPKPLKAFTQQNVPKGALWRWNSKPSVWHTAAWYEDHGMHFVGKTFWGYEAVKDDCEYSIDGGATWQAAGVEE